MKKEDAIIIFVGIFKDALRLFLGIAIYGIDLEITGRFFAELAPVLIVLGWAENVDSEFILDSKNLTSFINFSAFLLSLQKLGF